MAGKRRHENTVDAPVLQLHSISSLEVTCLAAVDKAM